MLLGEDCARFIVAECRPRTTKKLMMSTIYHANISVMSTSCAQDTRPQPECHKLCSIPLSLKLISTLATSYIKMMTNCTASERVVTRCAYAQGRVKRLSPSIYICVCVCVSAKNTAVCCLTARKSPRNSSLPLGVAIYILRKMPRKPEESSVECYGHGFLIAARPRGV